jgi:hypothetical protein
MENQVQSIQAANFRSRHHFIQYKQLSLDFLRQVISEFELTVRDLQDRDIKDSNIFYTLINKDGGYAGSSKEEFLNAFKLCNVTSININLLAKCSSTDKKQYDIQLFLSLERYAATEVNSNNKLFVYGDNEVWVKNTYARIRDLLKTLKNDNKIIYSPLFEMIIQLSAVLAIIAVATKTSLYLSAFVNVPYASVYTFVAVFLLFSNVWTFLLRWLINLRGRFFPSVGFSEKYLLNKVIKAVCSFLVVVMIVWSIETLLNTALKSLLLP